MMTKRLLDLFCGAGGAAMGYHRAGFDEDIVGVDIKPQNNYPFEFVQADALEYVAEHGSEFDVIHASPPCQAYVDHNKNKESKHPKLIGPIITALEANGAPYVVENVIGDVLGANLMLCGTMFGLQIIRHRFFRCSFPPPMSPFTCTHTGTAAEGDYAAVYSFGAKGTAVDGVRGKPKPGPDWNEAMGIDWMTKKELIEAIPPAYTEYIGGQMLAIL
tara:strand:- start:388 stop:1038 length:651 start_codon:yes stop_codon:yes gene_type:complete